MKNFNPTRCRAMKIKKFEHSLQKKGRKIASMGCDNGVINHHDRVIVKKNNEKFENQTG